MSCVRRRQWHPTPVFLPVESRGWGSLVGCSQWGRTESFTTEVTQQHVLCFLHSLYIHILASYGLSGNFTEKMPNLTRNESMQITTTIKTHIHQFSKNDAKKFSKNVNNICQWVCKKGTVSLEKILQYLLKQVAQTVKRLSTMQETRVRSLGWEDPLEKEMATHSRTIAWKTPWTEELVGYSPWGCKELDTTERLHFLSLSLK